MRRLASIEVLGAGAFGVALSYGVGLLVEVAPARVPVWLVIASLAGGVAAGRLLSFARATRQERERERRERYEREEQERRDQTERLKRLERAIAEIAPRRRHRVPGLSRLRARK